MQRPCLAKTFYDMLPNLMRSFKEKIHYIDNHCMEINVLRSEFQKLQGQFHTRISAHFRLHCCELVLFVVHLGGVVGDPLEWVEYGLLSSLSFSIRLCNRCHPTAL